MYCFHDTNLSTAKRSLIAYLRIVCIKTIPVLFLLIGLACLLNTTPVFAKKKATVQPGPTTCVVLPKNMPEWKCSPNYASIHLGDAEMSYEKSFVFAKIEGDGGQRTDGAGMSAHVRVFAFPANSPQITETWNAFSQEYAPIGYTQKSISITALGLKNSLSGIARQIPDAKDSIGRWFMVKGVTPKGTVVMIQAKFSVGCNTNTGIPKLPTYHSMLEKELRTFLAALRLHPSLFMNNNYKPPAPPPPPAAPVFSIVVNPSRAGSIENAVCKATVLNTGKVLTGTTDKNGKVSWNIPVTDATKPIKIRMDSVEILSTTIYHTNTAQNSMIYGKRSIKLVVNKQLQLNAANKFNLVYKQSVPLCRIQVNTAVWNPKTKVSEPRKCGIAIYNAKKFQLFVIRIIEFEQEGSIQMLIPARSVHNSNTLLVKASQVPYVGISNFAAPDVGNDSTSVSILLADQATHLAWIRDKILRLWTPIVGSKTAAKIANVNVKFTGEKVDYLSGTIRMPNNADFTVDSTATNVLHEWTHHINEVLFPNDAVEVDLRTGRQTSWAQSETLYSAWDEGRAHLLGQLMGQVLDTPNENEFVREKALNYISNLKSNQGAGCEAVIATSLLCHYGSGNYAGPQEAIADIFAVHKQCIKDFGHEPYSIYDFMTAKQRLLKSQSDAKGANSSLAKDRLVNLAEIKDNYKMRGGLQLGGQLEN
jgi:hypothetical protein